MFASEDSQNLSFCVLLSLKFVILCFAEFVIVILCFAEFGICQFVFC